MFLRGKIVSSLIVFAFTILVAILFAYNQTQQVKESQALVNNTNSVIKVFESLVGAVYEAQTAQHGYIITGRGSYLKRFKNAKLEIFSKLSTVKKLTRTDEKAQALISDLEQLLVGRVKTLDETVAVYHSGGFDKARHFVGADNLQDSLEKFMLSIDRLEVYQHGKLSRRMRLTEKRSNQLLLSIANYIEEHEIDYKLAASLGFTAIDITTASVEKVKDALNTADLKMYERKKAKKIN